MSKRFLLLCLVLLLAGCRLPALMPTLGAAPSATSESPTAPLSGWVGGTAFNTQATLTQIGYGATVSFIDPTTGNTVATAISDASGSFVINFGRTFVPVDGQAYYLEALKGIKGPNEQYNQAGADAVRLRTMVFYQAAAPTGWKSLANPDPGSISLNDRTTALSVALALKLQAGETLNLNDYIGALAVSPFVSVGSVSDTDYTAILGLVNDAITQDRDPMHYTVYDTVNRSFSNSWVGFSITDVAPRSGNINDTLNITGSGFDSGPATVRVNGVQATILALTADAITARVNPGSRTGPVSVQIGTTLQAGPTFAISVNDGHRAFLAGKLYVANPSWGTLSEVATNGDVKTVLTGLSSPTQVTAGPDGMLYVSCRTANKIIKVDPTTYAQSDFATLTGAYGLAFDASGNLYASSYQGAGLGTVVRLNSLGAVQATYTTFTNPTSLGFDYAGLLYVIEEAGPITKLTPSGADGAPRTALATIVTPRGLAIDSGGYLYVASKDNNAIYRVHSGTGAASVFTMINKPGGLSFDETGNMYVSDTEKNLVYRISPQGNLKTYAYGISNPRGLAIDPADGTIYVSLNKSNAILKVNPADSVLKPFVTGIANPLTLNFRDNGLFIAHPETNAVSFANRQGQIDTIATNVTEPSGADKDVSTGKIYIGRYGIPWADKPDRSSQVAGGFHVLSAGTVSTVYPSLRDSDRYLAINGSDTVFAVHEGNKTLTRYTHLGNSTYKSETLYTFTNTPGMVTYDGAGNLYVAVSAENAVYRFNQPSYTVSVLTGFNRPWGFAFDGAGVLYVSNTGDGLLRKMATPATATQADAWTSINVGVGVKGLAHLSGTLYMTDGTTIKSYSIAGNTMATYFSGLPRSVSTLWVKPDLTMYMYADSTFAYILSPGLVVSTLVDMTGWSRLTSIGFDPTWTLYRAFNYHSVHGRYGYIGKLSLSQEVELDSNRLYIASPDAYWGQGGVTRYDLDTNTQYQYMLNGLAYSVAVSSTRMLYVGASNNKVYEVNPDTGAFTAPFDLGTVPYGMDIRGTTLWAVGANNRVFELPIGGGAVTRYYGLMEPVF